MKRLTERNMVGDAKDQDKDSEGQKKSSYGAFALAVVNSGGRG